MVWVLLAYPSLRSTVGPKCVFYETTGLYCPGCGGTRAFLALTQGRVAEAFHDNLLWPFTLPLSFLVWASLIAYAVRGKGLPMDIKNPKLAIAAASVVIGYGVLRNIPFCPFNLLAPLPQSNSGMMQP